MISTSTTDPQNIKEVGGDIPMHDSSPIITPKKRKEVDGDVAMNDSSTFQRTLPLDSSPSITAKKRKEGLETDSSFAETPRRRGLPRASGSRSKKRKQGLSLATSSQEKTSTPSWKTHPLSDRFECWSGITLTIQCSHLRFSFILHLLNI